MPTLKEQIQSDMKEAMKARQQERLGTIRLLISEIKRREVDDQVVLEDAGVLAVIEKMIKQRRDSAEQMDKGGRPELAAKERAEIDVLDAYRPQQLDAAAVADAVAAAIAELGATGPGDMGKVMGALKARLAGVADMTVVSRLVKEQLAK